MESSTQKTIGRMALGALIGLVAVSLGVWIGYTIHDQKKNAEIDAEIQRLTRELEDLRLSTRQSCNDFEPAATYYSNIIGDSAEFWLAEEEGHNDTGDLKLVTWFNGNDCNDAYLPQ